MRRTAGSRATAKPLSVRYVGSLVADFHRNLLGGGLFAYPANHQNPPREAAAPLRGESAGVHCRAGRRRGHRRHGPVLDVDPTELHQRTPLFIGSAEDVALARTMLAPQLASVGA